ncbi:MAG: PepSY domain-containing protein, partial [Myxococcota bacterium]
RHRIPGARPRRIEYPHDTNPRWRVELSTPARTVVYYSASGTYLDTIVDERWLTKLFFRLHTGAVLGRTGELFFAFGGLVLIASILTGVGIWPRLLKRIRR